MRGIRAEVPIGKRVGSLVVLGSAETKRGVRYCRVRCTCGKEFDVQLYRVTHDIVQTCRFCSAKKNAALQHYEDTNKIPIGTRFGQLTVLGDSIRLVIPNSAPTYFVPVRCDCGSIILVRKSRLKLGRINKCSTCRNREISNIYSSFKTKVNGKRTRLFHIWEGMLERCYKPNRSNYKYYGEKGVTVCDEWRLDFNIFAIWAVTHGYDNNLTIDRINPFGNYTPDNCRWVTWKVQANNKRNNFRQPVQA